MRHVLNASKRALHIGKDTIQFATQMRKANGKTRLKTTAKLLGLITLASGKWFVRETWFTACKEPIIEEEWNPYTKTYEDRVVGTRVDKGMLAIGQLFSVCGRKVKNSLIKKI